MPVQIKHRLVVVVEVAEHGHGASGGQFAFDQPADDLGLGFAAGLATRVVWLRQKVHADDRGGQIAQVEPHPDVFAHAVSVVGAFHRHALFGAADLFDGKAGQHGHILAGERIVSLHEVDLVVQIGQVLGHHAPEHLFVFHLLQDDEVRVDHAQYLCNACAMATGRFGIALVRKVGLAFVAVAVEQEERVERRDPDPFGPVLGRRFGYEKSFPRILDDFRFRLGLPAGRNQQEDGQQKGRQTAQHGTFGRSGLETKKARVSVARAFKLRNVGLCVRRYLRKTGNAVRPPGSAWVV